ncbi:golgin IMH1, partial [Temnothorax curvispinosus]|uniref:Golgin IMH1 n=1 Tax=Temnothorax curvispinosus TaxID=300111 RepID=A0A6J1R7D6_9HYME
MEDDVDIYADLPSLDLNPVKNDQDCNCKELKKELDSLASKLENMQKIKTNLEKNLSSLLKTAKAEISRKDKMINDLRKQLDDVTFRRSNRSEASGSSTHRLPHQHTAKYENVPSTHSQESETESHEIQFHHDEYKSRKPQTDVNRIPTLFGERLQKRLMESEEEEKKQKEMLKLGVEVKSADIPENNVVENDKEIGSQFGTNDNNESNIERCSNSEPPDRESYKKKRTNEEDDTRRHKRLKMENNEDKTTTEETDYNYLTQYPVTDNSAQYENKDGPVKFENRPNAGHSFKKEEVPFCTGRRASSEYRDTKQDRSCANGWRSDSKNNSTKDHDSSNVKNDLVDSLRNSRTSNYVSERFNNGYKKNEYSHRHSPPRRRSYSRSRSDYESSSSHRLRERSSRTYREKKHDDYIYDSRYKNERLKKNHESEESDGKTRYRRGERDVLRDRSRYSSDRESSSSYKNKNTNQLEVADISTKKIEVAPYLQQNLKDCGEAIQLSSSKNDEIYNCRKNEDTCKSHINKDLMDSVAQNIGAIEQVHDSDIDDNDKNDADKTSKDFITDAITETVVTETAVTETAVTETAVIETAVTEIAVTETAITETAESVKIKETTADIESVTKIKESDDSNNQFESATKIDIPNIESVVEITEVNNFNIDNSIHKIDGDELKTSTAKVVTKVEAVLNCDIEDRDKSQAPIESETFHQMSSKSNVETCLNDHNYVQSPSIDVSDLGATKKSPLKSECGEAVPETTTTTTSKETKAEKINVQSVNSVKRTVSSTVKNKKDQQSKGILISHRRKAVILSDSNASMTVLMNAN